MSETGRPFERFFDRAAGDALLATLEVHVEPDAVVLLGECPLCGHQLDDVIPLNRGFARSTFFRGPALRADGKLPKAQALDVTLACNCESEHKGRPEGERGCGFLAGLDLELAGRPDPPAEAPDALQQLPRPVRWFVVPELELDPAEPEGGTNAYRATARRVAVREREWDERARELEFEQLSSIRSQAEKWSGSVAAITGLFGIALIFEGSDRFRELDLAWAVIALLLTAAAVLAAVAATWTAAIAAQGRRTWVPFATGRLLRRWDRVFARDAHDRLVVSSRATALAVLFTALAVAVLWRGPDEVEDAAGSSAVVVQASGAVQCGELVGEAGGTVRLRPQGAEEDDELVTLRGVASVVPVEAC